MITHSISHLVNCVEYYLNLRTPRNQDIFSNQYEPIQNRVEL